MYTQCPDCSTAFRVTAEVLKQAAGKVRCGGCGNAFNALDYLSEQKPAPTAAQEPEPSLPELKPEAPEEDDSLPKSISAEQSAALLKTLDELAGSNIRIEDTGVEWRVVDEDDGDADVADVADVVDTREAALDALLEESPTPVDQFLTATPNDVDAAEVFEESANEPGRTPVDELRFDDNTPLPDDFDLDDESSYLPEPAEAPEAIDEPEPISPEPISEEAQVDLDLSEPDEWEDILDEFEDMRGDPAPTPLEAELAALEDDQDEPETEAVDEPAVDEAGSTSARQELLDMDTQFALQAEAMGIDLTGTQKGVQLEDDVAEEAEEVIAEEIAEDATQLDLIEGEQDEAPLEFGAVERELAELEDQSDVFDSSFFVAADEVAAEIEEESLELEGMADDATGEEPQRSEQVDDEEPGSTEATGDEEPAPAEAVDDDEEAIELADEIELEEEIDLEAQPDLKEELELSAEPYPEDELALEEAAAEDDDAALEEPATTEDDAASETVTEHVIPEMTEEEQTINMMIDKDLMSLAVEDEDGFGSTIIIPEQDDDKKGRKRKKDKKRKKGKKKDRQEDSDHKHAFDEAGQGFETIIMEGEHVLSADEKSRREEHAAEAAQLVAASKAEEAAMEAAGRGRRLRMIGGAAALLLVLVVQVLHQSREALATYPLFNDLVGPVYRAIGKPLSPAWDITGWRIEATKGSIEENDEKLVVYSRIGNRSDKPLPYPIINISLTDRFEETLGSRQLDPADYLSDNLDPSVLVQPGNKFNAVISIQSPSAEASGYELDVCYRVAAGQLRCAIADFK